MTLRERYTKYLLAHDCEVIPTDSKKFIVLKSRVSGTHYFLGQKGSIRSGKTPYHTHSHDVSMQMKGILERWEQSQ